MRARLLGGGDGCRFRPRSPPAFHRSTEQQPHVLHRPCSPAPSPLPPLQRLRLGGAPEVCAHDAGGLQVRGGRRLQLLSAASSCRRRLPLLASRSSAANPLLSSSLCPQAVGASARDQLQPGAHAAAHPVRQRRLHLRCVVVPLLAAASACMHVKGCCLRALRASRSPAPARPLRPPPPLTPRPLPSSRCRHLHSVAGAGGRLLHRSR